MPVPEVVRLAIVFPEIVIEIAPALNVLTEAAQNRLRQQITMQGRKNLQEMGRPVGVVSLLVTFMLIIIPVVYSIANSLGDF